MFTGIVEATGRVISRSEWGDDASEALVISAPFAQELALGDSVSVNGVCLTVTHIGPQQFSAVMSPTTLRLTTMGTLTRDQVVNLERSVTPESRLGGHWVLGHVDATGTLVQILTEGDTRHLTIEFDPQFSPLVLPLGSITLDGISLTIVDSGPYWLTVTIIPHTLASTALQHARIGQSINLEFDVLGKYVRHLLTPYMSSFPTQTNDRNEGGAAYEVPR